MANWIKALLRTLFAAAVVVGFSACYYNEKPYFGTQRHHKEWVPSEIRSEPVSADYGY